jgi:hypothetical protein
VQLAAAPVTPALPVLDQNIVLRGVYINGTSAKAFLTSTENPNGGWIAVNGEIAGWRLVEIKPEQILLEGQGQKLAVKRSVVAK